MPGPLPRPDWYHGDWHAHWHHGWHYRPVTWWTAGFITGVGVSAAPWSWGYWSYHNPYCIQPVVIENTTIDYAQPIVLARPPAESPSRPTDQPSAEDEAVQLLEAGREAFGQGDYRAALTQADKAIARLPNDAMLHEFRALTLFAQKRYQEAAAAMYAVLSVGPGWDWTTLSGMYPSTDVYTEQLRALEQYRRERPNDGAARFLLAYHYLTCGHTEAAANELKEVVRVNPKDALSAQLLKGLTEGAPAEQSAPTAPAAPPKPVDAASLVGHWRASRPDGSAFALSLGSDGKYTWTFTQGDKTQQFSGAFSVADNLLILKQNGNAAMVGQITPLAGGGFHFKLAGDNPADPGLTFGR